MAKLLIVDDDPAIRGIFKTRFEAAGHEIVEANDGLEGLASVQRNPPDLILLDIMLPKIDGLEFCLRLKANPVTRSIPVVMMTAYDRDIEKIYRGRDTAPAEGYYSKFWPIIELEKMTEQILKSKKA